MFTNDFLRILKPYPIVSHKAWENIEDQEVLKLDWNELTVSPSPKVAEGIYSFLNKKRLNWYPDLNNSELIDLISIYTGLNKKNIQYFSSSDSLHEYIVRAFTEPYDKAIIISPTYDNFRAVVESNGVATETFYLTENNFELDYKKFNSFIRVHRPKLVYICNPNNPTGTIHKENNLRELIKLNSNVLFVIDEAYYEFCLETVADIVNDYENVVISRTFSKAFGLASFRIGYAISSESNIKALSKIRNPKSINAFAQVAACEALKDIEYLNWVVSNIVEGKGYLECELSSMGIKYASGGGNFILIRMDKERKDDLIAYLEVKKTYVRDYSHILGMENYFRVTIGFKEQMEMFVKHFKEFLENESCNI